LAQESGNQGESRASGESSTGDPVLERTKDAIVESAEAQKAGGASRLAGLGKAVHQAADGLEGELPQAAGYIHKLADNLDEASASLRNKNIEEITETVNRFARRNPAASFVGAVVAGFALSRFLKSSGAGEVRQNRNGARSST
jgi:hypothetical protein